MDDVHENILITHGSIPGQLIVSDENSWYVVSEVWEGSHILSTRVLFSSANEHEARDYAKLIEVMTAAEAASRWGLNPSTVRKAIAKDRLNVRKSQGTHLVTVSEMERVYGNEPSRADLVAKELTDADIAAWHEGRTTQHVDELLSHYGTFEVWGSRQGPEPLFVRMTD